MSERQPLVRMRGISKRFPGVVANDKVDLDLFPREILALLGENGAGKSTLMNILYGIYQPDEGEIWLKGQHVTLKSPADAIRHGIGMIHQEFMLVPQLTVAENVVLGWEPRRNGLLDQRAAKEATRALNDRYHLQVDPEAKVWQLSVGEQQRVEILKVLYRGARVLILDEPTAVLTPQETEELSHTLRSLSEQDHAVIFITHKMREVFAVADRVLVLRDGKVVARHGSTADTNRERLANDMVGRTIRFEKVGDHIRKPTDDIALRVDRLSAQNERGLLALKDVSFSIRKGEILGVAGVDGNGQQELVETLAGIRRVTSGHIWLDDEEITARRESTRRNHAIAHIPADRRSTGAVLRHSIAENAILGIHRSAPIADHGLLSRRTIRQLAERLVNTYDVRCPGIRTEARLLSGGNLQKLILARELDRDPNLILAAHPTRGLDVSATEYIHRILLEHRDRGAAVLFVSSELEELFRISDRLLVLYEGRAMGIVAPGTTSMGEIGLLMAGETIPVSLGAK